MNDQPNNAEEATRRSDSAAGLAGGRLGANLGAAWTVLRRPSAAAVSRLQVGRVSWVLWIPLAVVIVALTALIFDEGSVAWAASLPEWVRSTFEVITVAGKSDWYLIPTGALLIFLALGSWHRIDRRVRAAWAEIVALAGFAFLSVATAAIVVNLLKQIIGRARPVAFDEDGWLAFDAFGFDYANASFPSGHATTAGAVIIVGILIFPRLRVPIVVAGLAIAASRVVVGAHYPSDAVAGLATGTVVAYLVASFLLRRRVAFTFDGGGGLRARTYALRSMFGRNAARFLVASLRALAGAPTRV